MADCRKSSRARKAVSYSSFEADDDSGDDFAGSNPPPSKRTKLDRKERSAKDDRSKSKTLSRKRQDKEMTRPVTLTDGQDDPTGATRSGKERVSLDDKLFDREMQLALELSMQESQTDEQSTDGHTSGRKDTQAQIHTTVAELTSELLPADTSSDRISETDNKDNVALAKRPSRPAPSVSEPSDEIVLVETVHGDEVGGRGRRRAAARQAVARQREMVSEESDREEEGEFQADSSDNSSSDEYDAADSDYEEFATSKKKRKPGGKTNKGRSPKSTERGKKTEAGGRVRKSSGDKKLKAAPKTAHNKSSSAPKPTTPVTPLVQRPQVGGPRRGFTPPAVTGGVKSNSQDASQKLTPPIARKHIWASPSSSSESNPLGGVKLVSPGQPLRLGLSRNVRIKPLHPSAKVL